MNKATGFQSDLWYLFLSLLVPLVLLPIGIRNGSALHCNILRPPYVFINIPSFQKYLGILITITFFFNVLHKSLFDVVKTSFLHLSLPYVCNSQTLISKNVSFNLNSTMSLSPTLLSSELGSNRLMPMLSQGPPGYPGCTQACSFCCILSCTEYNHFIMTHLFKHGSPLSLFSG